MADSSIVGWMGGSYTVDFAMPMADSELGAKSFVLFTFVNNKNIFCSLYMTGKRS